MIMKIFLEISGGPSQIKLGIHLAIQYQKKKNVSIKIKEFMMKRLKTYLILVVIMLTVFILSSCSEQGSISGPIELGEDIHKIHEDSDASVADRIDSDTSESIDNAKNNIDRDKIDRPVSPEELTEPIVRDVGWPDDPVGDITTSDEKDTRSTASASDEHISSDTKNVIDWK
jgi:hypothetical protein